MREANRLGLRVNIVELDEPYLGLYDDEEATIYLRLGLPIVELREVLAHELGHALYKHDCTSKQNERQADRRAAQLLVDVDGYARAENINPQPSAIAEELGVTEKVVRDFQKYWLSGALPSASWHP